MTQKQAALRRYQSNLSISGAAVVVFGIWDIVKYIMLWLFGAEALQKDFDLDPSDHLQLVVFAIVFALISAVDFALRATICRNATREARGKLPRKNGWLIIVILLAAVTFVSIITNFLAPQDLYSTLDRIPTLVVDLSAFYALTDLLRSAYMARKTERALSEEG